MELTKLHPAAAANKRHSNYSIFKRVANLTLVVVAAAICVNLWLLNTGQANDWRNKQSTQLGRSIASYAATVIANDVEQRNFKAISAHLKLIANDPHIFGVSVYSEKGVIIESNEQNKSVLANFILNDQAPLVFVEEIQGENGIIGYLRLLLDTSQVMLYHDDYQTQLYKQLLALMMLAGLAGLLVARAYYKIRFRHYVKPNN
ncbi:MAG: hypothetical protein Alis3KO_22190 [Aliiglaciecola sp.]|uniref:AhpA/YtjB family protein n=1 Tax=Aliiglaciecola sp. M165 TaxID=2593649 RepID=UPI00117FDE93|nr:AhpA/YtjB family protein [Aliiglaciecola sp. M165]TRY30860.1 hypothetical protein FM019_13335 [Aliiglaciecola sp. M165]